MSLATLHHLLDDNLRLPPEYDGALTNHLPMALQALHALGAGDATLTAFAERYARRFGDARAPAEAAPPADWRSRRGTADAYASLHAHFRQALARDGRDAVLRSALPDLLPGLTAQGLHGPIRVAHAVESGHDGELAAALAYWAWRWQALAEPPPGAAMDFDDWTEALMTQALDWTCEGPLFSIRMGLAVDAPPYRALAGRLAPQPDLLARLSRFFAGRYAATRNLTLLHMVTGGRAIRLLLPWVADRDAALRWTVHAMTAGYLAARVPRRLALDPAPVLDWDGAIAAALASDNDHVVKLVQACRDEAAVHGEGDYLRAACRVLG